MPRQDVPYGGAICRLKERIAEIWDKLGEKLHSINGVEGDAAGDVKIVSGDTAVVVTSDQVNHEIEIALDSSQLPAAAVSSVNGQTGAVVLDAGDIPSDGNSDVQTDIDVNKAAISACSSAITSEQLARQNADSTLQGNINAALATIPTAAATAVANDPTVAQLVVDLGDKVDVSDVSTVETPDTIAKRNGSGRLVAADPANGATDKSLTTANWISQTGSGKPNNLVHDTGDETIDGIKGFLKFYRIGAIQAGHALSWTKLFNINSNYSVWLDVIGNNSKLEVMCKSNGCFVFQLNATSGRDYRNLFRIAVKSDSTYDVYINASYGAWLGYWINVVWDGANWGSPGNSLTILNQRPVNEPTVGDDYTAVYTSQAFVNYG